MSNCITKEETLSLFDLPSWLGDHIFEEEAESNTSCKLTCTVEEEDIRSDISLTILKRLIHPAKLASDDSVFERERYYHPEDAPEVEKEQSNIEKLLGIKRIVILMCHGGYFAGVVFEGKKVIAHKSFHHYVTRRKQGGRQSTRDKSGRRAKSGGASIRRYNEDKHQVEIRKLTTAWQTHLEAADLIFVHLPGRNKDDFIKDGEKPNGHRKLFQTNKNEIYIHKSDTRVRQIPFTTQRPTYSHARKVFVTLTSIKLETHTFLPQQIPAGIDPFALLEPTSFTALSHSLNSSSDLIDTSSVGDSDGSGSESNSSSEEEEEEEDEEENSEDEDE